MKKELTKKSVKRILLAGMFGPYGVDDEYGRKENIMELFHNQVTKAQGIGSFRFHHQSFALYFIAENIDADVTVLDFPSKARFIREIKKDYDVVGLSFITPNFSKAKEMTRLIRKHSPSAEIVLGGHGAAIEGVEELIECDHVVKGEGIRWMRTFLGQDPDAPIYHPTLPASQWQKVYGLPVPGPSSSLLVPGVGCVNGCNFCCTSHFFGKAYTSFIGTGREIFETAKRIADQRGTDYFFVMDENFLKNKERALELIDEMERNKRYFNFYLFSSAETITSIGIENLVRLGVQFIWIGLESKSKQGLFEKNNDIDPKQLVKQLRDHGIAVLASGILGLEHHTPENIQEDIDFMIDVEADMVQYMLYTALPVTALYKKYKRSGLLREDLPFEEWHGQKYMNWNHPAFPGDAPERWLEKAFAKEFEKNSSSMYRHVLTAFRGYKTLCKWPDPDEHIRARTEQFKMRVREYSIILFIIEHHASTELEKSRALALRQEIIDELGPYTIKEKAMALAGRALTALWKLRIRIKGDIHQPSTVVTHYKAGRRRKSERLEDSRRNETGQLSRSLPPAAAACVTVSDR